MLLPVYVITSVSNVCYYQCFQRMLLSVFPLRKFYSEQMFVLVSMNILRVGKQSST